MKHTSIMSLLTLFALALLASLSLHAASAAAQITGYSIQRVNHHIELMYTGHMVINDTLYLSGQAPSSFLIGLPYKYSSYLLKAIAYNAGTVFPVELGVQIGGQSGFYAARVNLSGVSPETFTVIFLLSNQLVTESGDTFTVDFPAYPAFEVPVAMCNVTLTLPSTASGVTIDKADGVVYAANFEKENLEPFTYSPAIASFTLTGGGLQLLNMQTLNRQVTVDPAGSISCIDTYRVQNNSTGDINSLVLYLPVNASSITVKDMFGRTLGTTVSKENNRLAVNATLAVALRSSESTLLSLEYDLPRVVPKQGTPFNVTLDIAEYLNYYVEDAAVTITPPEGARLVSAGSTEASSIPLGISKEVFQEKVTLSLQGLSYLDAVTFPDGAFTVAYDYSPLWSSFHQTIWVLALYAVVAVAYALWRKPAIVKPKATPAAVPFSVATEQIDTFTEAYEEKLKFSSELKLLEERAQRGRIPRRRYKVQRKTLEIRLKTLSDEINTLKGVFQRAGGKYADLVEQLERAENKVTEAEQAMKDAETRHNAGELSIETYKKLLEEYKRQKTNAEAQINGILLRLREEIH
jgi:hypothetical protein